MATFSRLALATSVVGPLACEQGPPPATHKPEAAEVAAAKTGAVPGLEDLAWMPIYCQLIIQMVPREPQYIPTTCWTTHFGPAKANVILLEEGVSLTKAKNMLYCPGGDYALCYFSGPPDPTGKSGNPALPCTYKSGDESANCTCQAFSGGGYFVDINAIGNLQVWVETSTYCGPMGKNCWNMSNYENYQPGRGLVAPVCKYVDNQNPDDPVVSLVPGADLISTYSTVLNEKYYNPGEGTSTECANPNYIPYAGCMTAPCNFQGGRPTGTLNGQPIQCACPVWNGPYQVGQAGATCALPSTDSAHTRYVWSAAFSVTVQSK